MAGRFGSWIAVLVLATAASLARGATFTVDDAADLVDQTPGDGVCATVAASCTLRAAIQEANALPGPDTIGVDPNITSKIITLAIPGAGEDAAGTGDLDITDDVMIDLRIPLGKPGEFESIAIDGAHLDRVIHVLPGVTATIDGFAILNGAVGAGENGGCILNEGTLQTNGIVVQCTAGGDGGAVYNAGTATLFPRFRDSTAGGRGGGVANVGTLVLERDLYDASIANDSAPSGGGIYNAGTLTANALSVMQNHATVGAGGGLLNDVGATAHLANLTIGANTATSGADGIENLGNVDLRYVTLNAHATLGLTNDDAGGATTSSKASVLGDACSGTVTSGGYNVATTCTLAGALASDQSGIDPGLESQASCAALYSTDVCPHYRPHHGSPVIDAGDPADCNDGFGTPLGADQALVKRPTGSTCDVGALEWTPVCVTGAPIQSGKLIISGIGAGAGRQKIRFAGRLLDSGLPNLSFFGAQLGIDDDGTGTPLVDRSSDDARPLGGGGSIPFSCSQWKRSSSGFSYREIDRCAGAPTDSLVKSVRVREHASGPSAGYTDLKFTVLRVTTDVPTGPLHVSFAYGSAAHFSGTTCAQGSFPASGCVPHGSGVKCKL